MSVTTENLKKKLADTGLPQIQTPTAPEQYQRTLDTSGLPSLYGSGDLEASRKAVSDALYQRQTSFLDPQYAQREQSLNSSLANKGVVEGSEAWRNLTDQFTNARTLDYATARNDAIVGGLNEMTGLSDIALKNRGQQFGERLSTGNFANEATASTNSDSRATTALNNSASVQAMTEALGLKAIDQADEDRKQAAKNALINGLFGLGSSAVQNTDLLKNGYGKIKDLFSSTDASGVPGDAQAGMDQWLGELDGMDNTYNLGSEFLGAGTGLGLGGAAAAGGGAGAGAAGGSVSAMFNPITGEILNTAAGSSIAGGAAAGGGGLLGLGSGVAPIGTGAIDAATAAGAQSASSAIAAANGGSAAGGGAGASGASGLLLPLAIAAFIGSGAFGRMANGVTTYGVNQEKLKEANATFDGKQISVGPEGRQLAVGFTEDQGAQPNDLYFNGQKLNLTSGRTPANAALAWSRNPQLAGQISRAEFDQMYNTLMGVVGRV